MTPVRPNAQTPQPYLRVATAGDGAFESAWPTAFRALLLLTEASHPGDPALARISDDELALLRAALVRLGGGEHTSAA